MADPAVVVGCATWRPWQPRTVASFLGLVLGGPVVNVILREHYIDKARNTVAADALQTPGATHLLFVDDDMTWPADAIPRLLAHRKPIIGGLYFGRVHPYDQCLPFDLEGKHSWKPGLQEVAVVGMGCTLIELDVFRQWQKHFGNEVYFRSDVGGEDIHFCNYSREMGVGIFLDGDVRCGHLNQQYEITEAHWRAAQ